MGKTADPAPASMSSGEVAARGGVSVDTLRHYERRGLLAGRRANETGIALIQRKP